MSTAFYIVDKAMRYFNITSLLVGITFFMVSCRGIRNTVNYNLELIYIEQGLRRQSITVGLYLKAKCCEGTKFIDTTECKDIRDTYVTIKERTSYHMDMMRYLARMADEKPQIKKLEVEGHPICE